MMLTEAGSDELSLNVIVHETRVCSIQFHFSVARRQIRLNHYKVKSMNHQPAADTPRRRHR